MEIASPDGIWGILANFLSEGETDAVYNSMRKLKATRGLSHSTPIPQMRISNPCLVADTNSFQCTSSERLLKFANGLLHLGATRFLQELHLHKRGPLKLCFTDFESLLELAN